MNVVACGVVVWWCYSIPVRYLRGPFTNHVEQVDCCTSRNLDLGQGGLGLGLCL